MRLTTGMIPTQAIRVLPVPRSKILPAPRLPSSVVQVAMALILALVAAPVVRTITSELTQSVGQTWPFSIEHCAQASPACQPAGPRPPGRLHSLASR